MPLSFIASGAFPAEQIEDVNGPTVDWNGVGSGYAIQQVGGVVSGTTITGKIQQSSNGSAWSDLPGAVFTPVVDSDQLEQITITPTMRYVRWSATLTGFSAFVSCLFIRC